MGEELGFRFGGQVSKLVVFQISPGIFDRIQLRRVGRQLIEVEAGVFFRPALNLLSPVGAQAIPNHKYMPAGKIELELLQERHALGAANIFPWVKPKDQPRSPAPGSGGNGANGRNFLMGTRFCFENWGFPAGGPRSLYDWRELQCRLVGENNNRVQSASFFLICESSFLTQWRIRRSSRSMARVSGR